MNVMLDVINEETGEVRGEVKVDINLLREQRTVLLERIEDIAELHEGRFEEIELLDGLTGMIDSILDVAEEGQEVG